MSRTAHARPTFLACLVALAVCDAGQPSVRAMARKHACAVHLGAGLGHLGHLGAGRESKCRCRSGSHPLAAGMRDHADRMVVRVCHKHAWQRALVLQQLVRGCRARPRHRLSFVGAHRRKRREQSAASG